MLVDTDDLIDSAQVAAMLGLSQRNSVLTYRNRYPSFPAPVIERPRIKLWRLQDVEAWQRGNLCPAGADGAARERLMRAARDLFAQRPASEVSVRDIATEAGVPHTVLYRYFAGKEALRTAVVAQTVELVRARIPQGASAHDAVLTTVCASLDHSSDFRILAFSLLVDDPPLSDNEVTVMAALVAALGAAGGQAGAITDKQCVALLGALVFGWGTFEVRIRAATGLEGSIGPAMERVVRAALQLAGHND